MKSVESLLVGLVIALVAGTVFITVIAPYLPWLVALAALLFVAALAVRR